MYLDDIITFSPNAGKHIWHVLLLLHKAAIALNLERYNFFTEKIDNIGHIVQPVKFEMADYSTDAVCALKQRRTVTE